MSYYVFWDIYKQHVSSFNYGKIQTTGAVLVAISIPIFNSQLEKAREATDLANIRAAYAEASAEALTADTAKVTGVEKSTSIKQTTAGWVTAEVKIGNVNIKDSCQPKTGDTVYVYVPCDGTAPTISTTSHGSTTVTP